MMGPIILFQSKKVLTIILNLNSIIVSSFKLLFSMARANLSRLIILVARVLQRWVFMQ